MRYTILCHRHIQPFHAVLEFSPKDTGLQDSLYLVFIFFIAFILLGGSHWLELVAGRRSALLLLRSKRRFHIILYQKVILMIDRYKPWVYKYAERLAIPFNLLSF